MRARRWAALATAAALALAGCVRMTTSLYDYDYEGERYLVEVRRIDRPAEAFDLTQVFAYRSADGERRRVSEGEWYGGPTAYTEARGLAQRADAPLALKVFFQGRRLGLAAPTRETIAPDPGPQVLEE